jgi:hypothetical protein
MILTIVSATASLLGISFLTFCLATGLYYLSELVEEYTVISRRIIKYSIVTILVLHPFMLIEGFPFWRLLLSFVATLWYSRLLNTFPVIDMSGPIFILSCILAILNHFSWFVFFKTYRHSFSDLVSFFTILVWLVPFMFMISLSANDFTLPVGILC